jgi:MOSC domain-containing protein YiiM
VPGPCNIGQIAEDFVGKLEQIWMKRAHRGLMDATREAQLEAGKGVLGSANYGGRRHVTIISAERWAELTALLRADIDPSARRANLMVSGLELAETRDRVLRVGTCRLLIGGETRPCERMEEAHAGLQEAMESRWGGGAWATVERGGQIRVGDPVEWE